MGPLEAIGLGLLVAVAASLFISVYRTEREEREAEENRKSIADWTKRDQAARERRTSGS